MSIAFARSLEDALMAAASEARRRRHVRLSLDHLLRELVRDEAARRVLESCGCDVAHLIRELDEYLDLLPELPPGARVRAMPDEGFRRAVEGAIRRAMIAGKPEVEIGDALVQLAGEGESYAAMLLHAEGLTRLDLLRCISHGSPRPSYGDLPASAFSRSTLVDVILHNDHYTTMEFVVRILCDVFGCSQKEAAELMLQVHRHGRAIIGHYPGDLAKRKADQVMALAAHEEFPLLCTLARKAELPTA